MNKRSIILLVVLIFIVCIAVFFFVRNDNEVVDNASQQQSQNSTEQTDPSLENEFPSEEGPKLYIGNPDARVIITEFIDYKCPNCNNFHRGVKKQLEETYGDSIAFEVHQTPFIGPDSGRAARGAYCSEINGAVFEEYNDSVFMYMYDNYYASQNFASEFEDVLTADVLSSLYESSGGNDKEAFRSCIENTEEINLYINADQLLAAEKEVRGTPSFVVGDTSLIGPQQFSVFKALIEAEL